MDSAIINARTEESAASPDLNWFKTYERLLLYIYIIERDAKDNYDDAEFEGSISMQLSISYYPTYQNNEYF